VMATFNTPDENINALESISSFVPEPCALSLLVIAAAATIAYRRV
jgi:hypothetical protein